MRALTCTVSLFLIAAASAHAQGLLEPMGLAADGGVHRSARERSRAAPPGSPWKRYGPALAADLERGAPVAGTQQIEQEYDDRLFGSPVAGTLNPDGTVTARIDGVSSNTPPNQQRLARGLRVDLGDVQVERLRFPNEADALDYGLFAADSQAPGGGPVLIEVRGDQVLTVHGEPLRDAQQASRIRRAAWDHLPKWDPAARAEPEVVGMFLGDDAFVLTSRRDDHALGEQFRKTLEEGRRRAADGAPYVTVEGDTLRSSLDTGFNTEVTHTPDGRGHMWLTTDPSKVDLLQAHQDQILADNQAAAAGAPASDTRQAQQGGGAADAGQTNRDAAEGTNDRLGVILDAVGAGD